MPFVHQFYEAVASNKGIPKRKVKIAMYVWRAITLLLLYNPRGAIPLAFTRSMRPSVRFRSKNPTPVQEGWVLKCVPTRASF